MKHLKSLLLVASFLVLLIHGSMAVREAFAKSRKSSRIQAKLLPPETMVTDTAARLDYRRKANGSKRDDRLTLTVKVPLPSPIPEVSTQAEAQSLSFRALFYRKGLAYALCELGYDPLASTKDPSVAQFKVTVRATGRKSKPKLKTTSGVCYVNLDTEAQAVGLPKLKRGDSVNIEEDSVGEFLGVIIR